ncbi:FixH family protein [Paenibacillus sp. 453mf]|uniref:FixH family protein n=1 Tax=Paenibacillus sp. 453mf TaxID=1761874 RepID=UPI0008E973B6|nr:FixH family protein [Paenibacillus sp. 453mf]SFS58237.1 YtkA-like [Paenibacillus sp. 453mf]
MKPFLKLNGSNLYRQRISMGFIIITLCILISGCSSDASSEPVVLMEPIEVKLSASSEEINLNETVHMEAVVTQQADVVDDADEVMFEIATLDGVGMQFEATNQGEGVYVFDYQFKAAGKYKVTSHVSARGFHSMPSVQIVVKE